MKKLSSKSGFFYKKVFPTLWFGFLACFILIMLVSGAITESFMFLLVPILMVAFGYVFFKKFLRNLAEEVYDEGDSLLFKISGKDIRVSLSDIKNVNYQTWSNPPRVSISLRHETVFGNELSFLPPLNFVPFKKNMDIQKLIDRIDQVRG